MTEPERNENPVEGTLPETERANGPTLAEALQQIEALNNELIEAHDKTLRAMAETENTRRRAERDRQDTAKFAVTSFARDLLSVADNLRRALGAIPEDQREANEQLKNIYTGVESTERELLRALERNGIKKIEALDRKFDPNFHEVMFEAAIPGKDPGTVIQVMEQGYMIHDRLLRPARVGVSKSDDLAEGSRIDENV